MHAIVDIETAHLWSISSAIYNPLLLDKPKVAILLSMQNYCLWKGNGSYCNKLEWVVNWLQGEQKSDQYKGQEAACTCPSGWMQLVCEESCTWVHTIWSQVFSNRGKLHSDPKTYKAVISSLTFKGSTCPVLLNFYCDKQSYTKSYWQHI